MSRLTRPERISSRCRIRSIDRSRSVTRAPRPEGDDRRVVADDPTSENDDVAGLDPGVPARSTPRPPSGFSRKCAAALWREPARNLAHRGEQRQAAVVRLDRLVGDGRDAAVRQRP
jgi:hypothetical protein